MSYFAVRVDRHFWLSHKLLVELNTVNEQDVSFSVLSLRCSLKLGDYYILEVFFLLNFLPPSLVQSYFENQTKLRGSGALSIFLSFTV